MKNYILILLLSLCFNFGFSQKKYSITSRKAIRYYETAISLYQNHKHEEALKKLDQALRANKKFIEAYLFKGDIYHKLGNKNAEIDSYEKAILIDKSFFPNVHLNLGNAYLSQGKYQKAKNKFNAFLSFSKTSTRNKTKAQKQINRCNFALKMLEKPVNFNPIRLEQTINTELDEYWPSLTADEEMLIFTRLEPFRNSSTMQLQQQEDFWISHKKEGKWQMAESLSKNINTDNNEGAQSITADGRIMYFTACNRPGGMGSCDIYYSIREGNQWSKPIHMGKPVNSAAWESQPSISADGKSLYFVSNRKSGKGKMDIWKSNLLQKLPDGTQKWSKPENLEINTENNEMSPFIHASKQYLIFSSDGLQGMGAFDLFKTTRQANQKWSKPKNLGYPINTHGNETGLVINAKGNKAYFSSDRSEGKGKDIFVFDLPKELQPPGISWLKGKVFDLESNETLEASITLKDFENGDSLVQCLSDKETGSYLICLPDNKNFLLHAQKKGYLFYSKHLSKMPEHIEKHQSQIVNIGLKKLKAGNQLVLQNIFFETDSWQILPKSETELRLLVKFLLENPNVTVEISGHTDNSGSETHNLQLSEKRAIAVCNYLIEYKISKSRLQHKGFGAKRPIANNNTEAGKSLNRRTECKIITH